MLCLIHRNFCELNLIYGSTQYCLSKLKHKGINFIIIINSSYKKWPTVTLRVCARAELLTPEIEGARIIRSSYTKD